MTRGVILVAACLGCSPPAITPGAASEFDRVGRLRQDIVLGAAHHKQATHGHARYAWFEFSDGKGGIAWQSRTSYWRSGRLSFGLGQYHNYHSDMGLVDVANERYMFSLRRNGVTGTWRVQSCEPANLEPQKDPPGSTGPYFCVDVDLPEVIHRSDFVISNVVDHMWNGRSAITFDFVKAFDLPFVQTREGRVTVIPELSYAVVDATSRYQPPSRLGTRWVLDIESTEGGVITAGRRTEFVIDNAGQEKFSYHVRHRLDPTPIDRERFYLPHYGIEEPTALVDATGNSWVAGLLLIGAGLFVRVGFRWVQSGRRTDA